MNKPICITFAWAVGSGKTPIATYLSYNLNLPVFNNDAIRSEIFEDFGEWTEEEYLARRNNRCVDLLKSNRSFIFDASIDRTWSVLSNWLTANGYVTFVISLDASEKLLRRLYESKWYSESMNRLAELVKDHERFLEDYEDCVNLHIDDKNFPNRLELSLTAAGKWMQSEDCGRMPV